MSAEEIIQELSKLSPVDCATVLRYLRERKEQEESLSLHEPAPKTPTLERIEDQVKQLSKEEQESLKDWLENALEDALEFTEEFKASIQRGEQGILESRGRVLEERKNALMR